MSPRTKRNLNIALERDAVDAATYSRFAARARSEDDWNLAQAFQETADRDRVDHFAKEAELERLIASSPDNLRNAIEVERKEAKMYSEFGREAKEDGDLDVASVFENISRDKAERCARFEGILEAMGIHGGIQTITD